MAEPTDKRPLVKVNLPLPAVEVRLPGRKNLADFLQEQTPATAAALQERITKAVPNLLLPYLLGNKDKITGLVPKLRGYSDRIVRAKAKITDGGDAYQTALRKEDILVSRIELVLDSIESRVGDKSQAEFLFEHIIPDIAENSRLLAGRFEKLANATPEEKVVDTATAAHAAVGSDLADLRAAAVPVKDATNSAEAETLGNIRAVGEAAGAAAHSAIDAAAAGELTLENDDPLADLDKKFDLTEARQEFDRFQTGWDERDLAYPFPDNELSGAVYKLWIKDTIVRHPRNAKTLRYNITEVVKQDAAAGYRTRYDRLVDLGIDRDIGLPPIRLPSEAELVEVQKLIEVELGDITKNYPAGFRILDKWTYGSGYEAFKRFCEEKLLEFNTTEFKAAIQAAYAVNIQDGWQSNYILERAGIPFDWLHEVEQQEKVMLTAGGKSVASEEHSDRNEDAVVVNKKHQLYAVFDGMSFPLGGEIAASLAASEVERKFSELPPNSSVAELEAAMRQIIEHVNKAIYDLPKNANKEAGERIGTTATIAKVWRAPDGKRKLVIGQVGDSRAYLQYPDGRFEQLTLDDCAVRSYVGNERWKELQKKFAAIKSLAELTIEEKTSYRFVNQITAALGIAETIDPQIIVVDFPPGARLLLTTDGIHDPLTDSAMAETLKNSHPGDAIYRLVNQANDSCADYRAAVAARVEWDKLPRGKPADDKTIIVVELTPLVSIPEATVPEAAPYTLPDYSLRSLLNEQKVKFQFKDDTTALAEALQQTQYAFSGEIAKNSELMTALREAILAALTSQNGAVPEETLLKIVSQTGLKRDRIESILAALQSEVDDQAKAASRESLKKVLGKTALKVAAIAGVSTLAVLGGAVPVGLTLAGLATARVLDNWRVHGKQKRQIEAAKAVIQKNFPEHYLKNFIAMLAQAKQADIDKPAAYDTSYIERQLGEQLRIAHPDMTGEDHDRLVNATLALVQLDANSQKLEDQYQQSQPNALDKLSSLVNKIARKVLPAGSLAEKNLTTVTFAAMGFMACEVPILRNVLTGIAGVRLGGVAAGWIDNKTMGREDHRFISAEEVQKKFDLENIEHGYLARVRAQLTDRRWQGRSADLQRLHETLDAIESQIIKQAEHALAEINHQTARLERDLQRLQQDKRANRIMALVGRVVGGAIGAMLPELIHSLSDHAPVSDVSHQTVSPPASAPIPEPSIPAPAAEPLTPAVPAAPPVEAVSTVPAATVIRGDQGISHGLSGKVSTSEMNNLLHDTKVTIGGHEVTLADTGVAKAGTLEVGVGTTADGKHVIQLLDARTHQAIAADELDDYLYDRSSGAGPVQTPHVEAPSQVDHAVESAPAAPAVPSDESSPTDYEPSEAAPLERTPVARSSGGYEIRPPTTGETPDQYLARSMREYIVLHPEYSGLGKLPDNELIQRTELSSLHEQLAGKYRESFTPPSAPEPTEAPVALVDVRGRLTEAGKQELNLAEHFNATGESESYTTFKNSIIRLLEQSRDHRVRTPNGLMFEVKAGQLYVDVAGGGRDAYLVDDKLYENLMRGYQEIVKPTTGGRFTPELFYQTLDIADVEHTLHKFELERMNLNHFIDKGQPVPYHRFTDQISQFMSDHSITTFTGPNNLVFRLDHDQLFVDLAGGAVRNFPLTEGLYTDLLERYQDLGYDYHEQFDVDQFYDVVKKQ